MTSVTPAASLRPSRPNVLVIGTFDTKSDELGALADAIEGVGGNAVLLDTSARFAERPPARVLRSRRFIDQDSVARAAGSTTAAIDALPRGEAVSALRAGVTLLLTRLRADRDIDAAICMGGAGVHIAGPGLQNLPLGFPKLIVSPLASGSRTFESYVGIRDVAVMHSVADIIGINAITEPVYRTAAGYIVGAARAAMTQPGLGGPDGARRATTVAVSMNGNTTAPLMRARAYLEQRGVAFVAFHANGTGGRALEDAVRTGQVDAVLDYTTTELAGHLVGGLMDPGPDRMETAGLAGLPQILVPGCTDFITCGPLADASQQFPNRTYFGHNPELTLVRLTTEEAAALGEVFANKANKATGPTRIFIPTGGFSVPDAPGLPFWHPEANAAFTAALRTHLGGHVGLTELDHHINDDAFIDDVLSALTEMLNLQPAHPPAFA